MTMLLSMKSGLSREIMLFTSALKPALTEIQKIDRVLKLSLNLILLCLLHNKDMMYDSVHVDKKWFFVSGKELHLYITTDETVLH